jgi:ADP-ribose pyrophosphatase YjhB (NUDIX family)
LIQSTVSDPSSRPRVTVATLIEQDQRFLLVEELTPEGQAVFNQPAGHVEGGESLIEAAIRETLEETGWQFEPHHLVGCYLWGLPAASIHYLRFAIAGCAVRHDPTRPLDDGILRTVWLSLDELKQTRARHRSPLVLRTVEDYLAGEIHPLSTLKYLAD